MRYDKSCKIALIGPCGAGKTSFLGYYITKRFNVATQTTIGACFMTKDVSVNNKVVKLDIWDTAGQERFSQLLPMYIRGSEFIILCMDKPNDHDLLKFFDYYKIHSPSAILYLLFTKSDLIKDIDDYDSIKQLANEKGIIDIHFVSSKKGQNIDKIFEEIAQKSASIEKSHEDFHVGSEDVIEIKEMAPKRGNWCYC